MVFKVDFAYSLHSCFSDDGEFAPIELLKMGKEAGLDYMAIAWIIIV